MRSTFKILFYINRQKTKADGNTAILCRITIDGKSTAIITGEKCKVSEWNSKQGLTTNRKTNQRINEFRELIEKTYRDILTRDGVVSVELIRYCPIKVCKLQSSYICSELKNQRKNNEAYKRTKIGINFRNGLKRGRF